MSIEGWYYLHTNGDLIYKRDLGGTVADIRESDFARHLWPVDPTARDGAWAILVEALALGASPERVKDLAAKWHCDDADADKYAAFIGVTLQLDGDQWCATGPGFVNLQESHGGHGSTKLEAMADLCRRLGFRAGKMWQKTFRDLLSAKP